VLGGNDVPLRITKSFNEERKVWNVKLIGEVDIKTSQDLKALLNESLNQIETDILLDCSDLNYIDSTGLGVIIGVLNRVKKNENEIFIDNAKNNVSKLFKITGLDRIIKVNNVS